MNLGPITTNHTVNSGEARPATITYMVFSIPRKARNAIGLGPKRDGCRQKGYSAGFSVPWICSIDCQVFLANNSFTLILIGATIAVILARHQPSLILPSPLSLPCIKLPFLLHNLSPTPHLSCYNSPGNSHPSISTKHSRQNVQESRSNCHSCSHYLFSKSCYAPARCCPDFFSACLQEKLP